MTHTKTPQRHTWRTLIALLLLCMLAGCRTTETTTSGTVFRDDHVAIPQEYQFRDLNDEQLTAARRYGLRRPPRTRKEARRVVRRLKHIETCALYRVDPLTHSMPYLNKGARSLLRDIAEGFQYALRRGGYREHRIIVTSLLRTEADVESLRKVNGNAARNSSHCYATTFDLSYTRYDRTSTQGRPISNEQMARFLAAIISEFRARGDCVVIYERQQHCFHITVCR